MIYAATNGPATLIVEQDTDPVDPRVDCDPFGHLVCWHRRYFLGDGHHYETPWDCLRELCSGCVQNSDALDDMSIDDLKALLARQTDLVILPVCLYDHSGLAMSTGSFLGRAPHADWDSGQVGYIYATSEDILKTFGDITPETVKRAREALEAEVRDYDAYLRGDCWGYRVFMYGREMDACWGFLGDIDEVKPVIASCLAPGWNSLVLPRFSCHTLRHTFCTNLCAAGVDVKTISEIMGHADVRVTLEIYTEVTKDMKTRAVKSLEDYLNEDD